MTERVLDIRAAAERWLETAVGSALTRDLNFYWDQEESVHRDACSKGKNPLRVKRCIETTAARRTASGLFGHALKSWLIDTYVPEYEINFHVAAEVALTAQQWLRPGAGEDKGTIE